jgi:anti-anti-sigma factor
MTIFLSGLAMLNHLKIFGSEQVGDVLVVIPAGEGSAFRYQDLHIESNAIRAHMLKGGCKHIIVDLNKMDYFGSEFIGSLVTMLREVKSRGGKACFCSATPQMMQVLQNMSLFKLWPHLDTRAEAIELVNKPK